MISLVIVAHSKQLQNLPEIVAAFSTQDFDAGVLVFEGTPTDFHKASELVANTKIHTIHAKHDFSGFSAGSNRDIGIAYISTTYGASDFIFIDGDCVPSPNLIAHHKEVLGLPGPVVTCGLRVNRTSLRDDGAYGKHNDRRLMHPNTKGRLFSPGIDRAMLDAKDILAHNVCWSCNLGVNDAALVKIREANRKLVADTDRVFSSVFDGLWGGEDTLLGAAAFRTSCSIVMLNPMRSGVEHIFHTVNHQGNHNLRRCFGLDQQLQDALPATSVLALYKSDEPLRADTKEFYSSITHVPALDSWVTRLSAMLNIATVHEFNILQYLMSRNPKVSESLLSKPTTEVTNTIVLDVFMRARTTPIDIRRFLVAPT